jgi:hypothetical protein
MSKYVYVYRNLNASKKTGKPVYSVMRQGKVVKRVHRILLRDVTFVVRQAGRQKVLREKRKNVHAFVKGLITRSAMGIDRNGKDLPMRISYNPYVSGSFRTPNDFPVQHAGAVLINENGVSAAYVY